MTRSHNVLLQIRAKERGAPNTVRLNHSIMRNYICQEPVQFMKTWQFESKSKCVYDCNRIFFDNFRASYHIYGHRGQPTLLKKLPKCSSKEKIEDALVCHYHIEEASHDSRPHLIALTKDNWLKKFDLQTMTLVQKVYLHPRLNYHYLNWNDTGTSFVVKSTMSKTTPEMRAANIECNILLTMAVFSVYPLELKACFEVDKRIFGQYMTGAHLDGGSIFFTTHQCETVMFYSFERMLEDNERVDVKLGDDFPNGGADGCKVGEAPHGIPITLKIKECPAVLLQVSCYEHDVQFGGFPWHYMTAPRKMGPHEDPTHINIYNLATKERAINGHLDRNTLAVSTPAAFFHTDGSDRIVNTKVRSMSVFKIRERDDGKCEVVEDHVIEPWPFDRRHNSHLDDSGREVGYWDTQTAVTRSGRLVKTIHPSRIDGDGLFDILNSEMICNISNENDLDLMVVTMPSSTSLEYDELEGHVTLHDNETGRLLKIIKMEGEWDDTVEHYVSLDFDTLIHMFKKQTGKWVCEVYRALRKDVYRVKTPPATVTGESSQSTSRRHSRSSRR